MPIILIFIGILFFEELKGKGASAYFYAGDQYGIVLEKGEIQLEFNGRVFSIRYFDHRLPVKDPTLDRLAHLAQSDARIQAQIDHTVKTFNGQPGRHQTFNPLHALLEAQAYRLAYWKTASHEINYRRFFDINSLAGLRVENPRVFSQIHELVMQLIGEGSVTGLRIDHPDGLYDPALYFESIQDLFLQEWVKRSTNEESSEQMERVRGLACGRT